MRPGGTGERRDSMLLGLCIGGLVGFALGVLFAPAPGPVWTLGEAHDADRTARADWYAEPAPPAAQATGSGISGVTEGGGAG